jgi:hypothetical protein
VDDRSANAVRELDDFGVAESLNASDGAEPLFVINLCAAMTPQNLHDTGIPGIDRYKLYQVSRMEDGRRRYRLRLGFFTSEAAAEDVLVSVRSRYATAFTACLCDEDLKHASGYLKRSMQDLARTGRFKISPSIQARQEREAAKAAAPLAAPAATVAKAAPQPAMQAAPPARPLDTKVSFSKDPVKPVATKPVTQVAKPAAPPVAAKPIDMRAARNKLDDSAIEAEITWVPDQLDTKSAKPVTSSVPRATVAAVSPAQIGNPKAAAKNIANSVAASAKSAPTPPPAVNVAAAKQAANALTLEKVLPPPVPPKASPTASAAAAPFHVGARVKIPDVGLTLANDVSTAQSAAKPTAKPVAKPAAPVAATKPASAAPMTPPAKATPASALGGMSRPQSTWRNSDDGLPTLDTTQTIRDLTQSEIDDALGLKWFVVQLALSDQPVNLDTMPRLDIFEAYRLYSVALMENGGIRHALRLGFFTEQVSAEAVLGYLKTFFASPEVERISKAEYERFSAEPPPKKNEVEPKSNARVITLEEKRQAPPTTLSELRAATSIPTIHEAVAAPRVVPTSTTMYRTSGKYAAPAVKRSGAVGNNTPLKKAGAGKSMPPSQRDLVEEARSLGLSDTQIIRVQKNPSLLSRLVGKLTK